jgi:GNAT superfamily N-acetyltransferase
MSGARRRPEIHRALPAEFERLRAVESEADGMFAEVGIGPFDVDGSDDHLARAAVVLVVRTPAAGFASVAIVDGTAHLSQLAVLPAEGRRGLGTALVVAVFEWARAGGFDTVTLTTFRDVPWNAPFYERMGFRPVAEPAPGLAAIREHEKASGYDGFGPRIAMGKDLRAPAGHPAR